MEHLDGVIGKGRDQMKQENVTNMYAKGLPPEQIARYLRLYVNTVTKILSLQ